METRSSSRFSGVFTLKTQAEANELAAAVTTLVERGVNIFQELEKGTSHEIEDTLKAVIRSFCYFLFFFLFAKYQNIKKNIVINI